MGSVPRFSSVCPWLAGVSVVSASATIAKRRIPWTFSDDVVGPKGRTDVAKRWTRLQGHSTGKALEAFDQYYADDVTMQENDQPPRVGKAVCRAFEADFLSKIKAVRTFVCDGYVISGNKAFIVYRIDADHADWGTLKMSEVAIQE